MKLMHVAGRPVGINRKRHHEHHGKKEIIIIIIKDEKSECAEKGNQIDELIVEIDKTAHIHRAEKKSERHRKNAPLRKIDVILCLIDRQIDEDNGQHDPWSL